MGNVSEQDRVVTLAETMAAVLCHDLSSPLSTLMGALELADEDPGLAAEALALAREASNRMGRRLRLVRAAWGGDCGPQSRDALEELLAGLPPRVMLRDDGLIGEAFSGPMARALLNAALLAVEALPRGGTIAVSGDPATMVLLRPVGTGAAWPGHVAGALQDPWGTISDDVRTVQAPYAALMAAAAGRDIRIALPSGTAAGCAPLVLRCLT